MADVHEKAVTRRRALAYGRIIVGEAAFAAVRDGKLPKGDALPMAELAGILGAKATPTLIPLCHPISLSRASVHTRLDECAHAIDVYALAEISERTGVEMEALTGATVALLTLWDLVKPVNPALLIDAVRLLYKSGGKHGEWRHPDGVGAVAEEILGFNP
ncbi:cyclic pyranopterin monophosphate synthase MoaC [Marinihelvus fidelis]|uniref:Cyclic pyranopterin monophosphate synthase MoaC n=2 Tax=Marinihelvus fidelis TaxID=2613842 RepID=A0A5N0TCF1_9GAMM|nr:cyclic pyranopterin monophosphate synthase MoaC [Marinihelvus fidelis]